MQLIASSDLSRRRRGPFLAPLEIATLAVMVAALLFLLFPGRDFENPRFLARPDQLSVAVLRGWLRAHPDQDDVRVLLARQLLALGRLDEARDTLALLPGRADARGGGARLLALAIDRARLNALAPGDPARRKLQDDLGRVAVGLIPSVDRIDDLADLADLVLGLGDPAAAVQAYQRLANLDQAHAVGWLEKAGRWSYAADRPADAARAYTAAAVAAIDAADGARLSREALRALLAANQGKAAMTVAQGLVDHHPADEGVLAPAIRLALAVGDLDSARRWGGQRVAATAHAEPALRDQIAILVQSKDPAGALKLARELALRHPQDRPLRRQVALLAGWSSRPEESMRTWAALAREGDREGREQALRLARALNDLEIETEMLLRWSAQTPRMSAPTLQAPPPAPVERAPRALPLQAWPDRRRPRA
jgi:tetratricopeptide (TPR) repeat protein